MLDGEDLIALSGEQGCPLRMERTHVDPAMWIASWNALSKSGSEYLRHAVQVCTLILHGNRVFEVKSSEGEERYDACLALARGQPVNIAPRPGSWK